MSTIYIDEVKEVPLNDLSKIKIDYHSYVNLDFMERNDQKYDQVKITRSYEEIIKQKKDEDITINKKVSSVIDCKFLVYDYKSSENKRPSSAWLSTDGQSFLYMLRLFKPGDYLRFECWTNNSCNLFEQKGLVQETLIIYLVSKKDEIKFRVDIDQVHEKTYQYFHLFRFNEKHSVQKKEQSEVIVA